MKIRFSILLSLALMPAALANAADWPNYGGPNHNNISPEDGLLQQWPGGGPEMLWQRPLGPGYGGAAIRDGKVYMLDRVDNQGDVFRCLNLENGDEIWSRAFDAPGKFSFNGSRTVPSVTAERIFGVGLMGDLYCLDRESGKLLWRNNLVKDFGGKNPKWGVSQTPFVYKDAVLVAAHGKSALIAKYDRQSGDLIWKSGPLSPAPERQYTSPVVFEIAGIEQVVMTAPDQNTGVSVGLDYASGERLWSFDYWRVKTPVPTPIKIPGDRLFFTAGYGAGSTMVRIVKNETGYEVEKLFHLGPECASQIHQPILYKNHIYLNSNSNANRDGMTCLDLDGNIMWQTGKSPNFERGNLILADNRFYNLDGQTGILYLIEPDPSGYKEISSFQALDGKQIWAPMAISNGRLVVRDQDEMKCYSIKN